MSPVPAVPWEDLKRKWKHLEDLPTESSGGRVDILLGSDVVHITTTSESRIGRDYKLTASLTWIWWIVRGAIGESVQSLAIRSHAIFAYGGDVDRLAQQLRSFCDTEDFGREHQQLGVMKVDKQAMGILEEGTRRPEKEYEVPILWKTGEKTSKRAMPPSSTKETGARNIICPITAS